MHPRESDTADRSGRSPQEGGSVWVEALSV